MHLIQTALFPLTLLLISPPPGKYIDQTRVVIPKYPTIARLAGIDGSIKIRLTINKQHKIETFAIYNHPANMRVLSDSAIKALDKWIFDPKTFSTIITFNYVLMPPDTPESELESVVESSTTVTIKDKRMPPVENGIIIDPSAIK